MVEGLRCFLRINAFYVSSYVLVVYVLFVFYVVFVSYAHL